MVRLKPFGCRASDSSLRVPVDFCTSTTVTHDGQETHDTAQQGGEKVVRGSNAEGEFVDIQSYQRAHSEDIKRTSQAEVAKKAAAKKKAKAKAAPAKSKAVKKAVKKKPG